jgi:hydrogenase expression/formation protein HypC
VHVGFAISTIDEEEAQRTYEALAELGQLSELDSPDVDDGSDMQLMVPRREG